MLMTRDFLKMSQKIEFIQKMISLPEITLLADEADKFIELVWDQSILKKNARLVKMSSSKKNIRQIGIGTTRILHPEAYFTTSGYKKEFVNNDITLNTEELRACVVIKDSDLEDINVGTAAQFKAQLMSMVTKKLANELDEIYWIADKESLSGFEDTDARSVLNGFRYQLDHSQADEAYENDVTGKTIILDASNTVTAKAASYNYVTKQAIVERNDEEPFDTEYKFDKMVQYLPSEYKMDGLTNFRFFVNDQIAQNFTSQIIERSTALGDKVLTGEIPLRYGVIPIVQMPLMPTKMKIKPDDVQHEYLYTADGNLTDCVLTHWQNFVIGIQTEIQFEAERSAADRATYFFYTIRTDCAMEDVHAAVLLKRLKII